MTTVAEALAQVAVSRLVHFTPVVNLFGILDDGMIRDSQGLATDDQPRFLATDHQRVDNQPGMVCCSFEYPNPYYEAIARRKTQFRNYPTWVCLTLRPQVVLTPGTLFHPCNAARAGGGYGATGGDALLRMWDTPAVVGGWPRRATHNPAVPTDLQAEVQIPGPVGLSAVESIVVECEDQARELFAWLDLLGAAPGRLAWRVAPMLFNKNGLIWAVQQGQPIAESVFTPNQVVS